MLPQADLAQERQVSAALTAKVADLQQKLAGASKGLNMYKVVLPATEQQQPQQQVHAPRQPRQGSLGGTSPKSPLVGSIYKSPANLVARKTGDTMLKTASILSHRIRYSATN